MESGRQQRLAEAAWTTKEDVVAQLNHLPHQVGLIDIHITITYDFSECLNTRWVKPHFVHSTMFLRSNCEVTKKRCNKRAILEN
jgi:hypothetical protein